MKSEYRTAVKVGVSVALLVLLTSVIHYYVIPDGVTSLVISGFIAGVIWYLVRKKTDIITMWG